MFVLQLLVLIVLLLILYGVYRALMQSQVRAARIVGRVAGTAFAVLACVLALVVRPMVWDSAVVTSDSMEPTLHVGDRILAGKLAYKRHEPMRGDIITFRFPSRTPGVGEDVMIKRVIGVPGDVIEVRSGAAYRNGARLDEDYIRAPMEYSMPPVRVTQGRLLVLGDNRNESDDSHAWGLLDRRRVIGRASTTIWPLSRMGSIR